MTAVFVIRCDAGQLMTQGLFPVLLSYFALPVMFSSAALWMCVAAGSAVTFRDDCIDSLSSDRNHWSPGRRAGMA